MFNVGTSILLLHEAPLLRTAEPSVAFGTVL